MFQNIRRMSTELISKWRASWNNRDRDGQRTICTLPPYCEQITNHRRNQSTPLTIVLVTFCAILSIFVIAPYMQEAFSSEDEKGKKQLSSATANNRLPSQSPSISLLPTTSSRPTVSIEPSIAPSVSFAPTISNAPSVVPTDPVPSAAPSDHFASTKFAFFFLNGMCAPKFMHYGVVRRNTIF